MPRYTLILGLEDPTVKYIHSLQLMLVAIVLMEMFVWWEAPISMRVEWRCASMTSGGQCVITPGTALMLLLSANNWDMHTLEVSICFCLLYIGLLGMTQLTRKLQLALRLISWGSPGPTA